MHARRSARRCIGLVSALVGDGFYDGVSWLALGWPVWVGARHWMR
jgi:hypothetical protein